MEVQWVLLAAVVVVAIFLALFKAEAEAADAVIFWVRSRAEAEVVTPVVAAAYSLLSRAVEVAVVAEMPVVGVDCWLRSKVEVGEAAEEEAPTVAAVVFLQLSRDAVVAAEVAMAAAGVSLQPFRQEAGGGEGIFLSS